MTIIERLEYHIKYVETEKLGIWHGGFRDDLAALLECVRAQHEALQLIADGQVGRGQTVRPMRAYQMSNVAEGAAIEAQKKVGLK